MTMKALREPENMEEKELPKYEPPEVITYTEEEILEELGPAQANLTPVPDSLVGIPLPKV